jgi:hypothetical protein
VSAGVKRPKGYRGAKQNAALYARNAEQIADEAFILSCVKHVLRDSRGELAALAKAGASNGEVRAAVGDALGIHGGTTGPAGPGGPHVSYWGGKAPRITVEDLNDAVNGRKGRARTLAGAELVRAVRWLFKIALPGKRWDEDRDALEHGAPKPTWGDHVFEGGGYEASCARCSLQRRFVQRRSLRRRDKGALVRYLEIRWGDEGRWSIWKKPSKPPPCTPAGLGKPRAEPTGREPAVPAGGYLKKCLGVEWYTPESLLAPVRLVLTGDELAPIPLDPFNAPHNPTGAARFFTKAEDGCARAWDAPWFVNPPYGRALRPALAKIGAESLTFHAGARMPGVALLPCSRWEQGYMHDLLRRAVAVCYVRKRVKFVKGETGDAVGGTPMASMFLGFNVDPLAFAAAFRDVGLCLYTSEL